MIKALITKDGTGSIRSFSVKNHGKSIVCAAVSMLVLNTVNSIEAFTKDKFNCEYDEAGGYLEFSLLSQGASKSASVLLDAMELGLKSTLDMYPKEISIEYINK